MYIDDSKFHLDPAKSVGLHRDEYLSEILAPFNEHEVLPDMAISETELYKFLKKEHAIRPDKYINTEFEQAILDTVLFSVCSHIYSEFNTLELFDSDWIQENIEDASTPFIIDLFNYFVQQGKWIYEEKLQLHTDRIVGVRESNTTASYLDIETGSKIEYSLFHKFIALHIIKEIELKNEVIRKYIKSMGAEKIYSIMYESDEDDDDQPCEDWIYGFNKL